MFHQWLQVLEMEHTSYSTVDTLLAPIMKVPSSLARSIVHAA